MQFFFHYELVKTKALCARLLDEKVMTVWKEDDVIVNNYDMLKAIKE